MKVKRSMGAIKFVLNERSKIRKELQFTQMIENITLDDSDLSGVGVEVDRAALSGASRATRGKQLADTKPGGVSK